MYAGIPLNISIYRAASMLSTKLFIPKTIMVGFRERADTFTGKLAYVIYFDETNVLRKQKSWDCWRNKSIEPITYENTPKSGFILNKGVQRSNRWANSGRSVIRVYDSRDFEFEISIDNLLGIISHSDVSKRDIMEECVFAWNGSNLVLLPCNSVEYQESISYTAKQNTTISTKDLIPGYRYVKKKSDDFYTYIGRFDWWEFDNVVASGACMVLGKKHINKGKKHIFWDGRKFMLLSVSTLSAAISDSIVDEYPYLVDQFFSTYHSQAIVGMQIAPLMYDPTSTSCIIKGDQVLFKSRGTLPTMCCIIDNLVRSVHGCIIEFLYTDLDKQATLQLNMNKSDDVISYEDSIIKTYKLSRNAGWTSPGLVRLEPFTKPIMTFINHQLPIFGITINELTMQQYIDILYTHGYGVLQFVLANGNIAEDT